MKRITFGISVFIVLVLVVSVFAAQLVRLQPLTTSVVSTTTSVTNSATKIPATALVGREVIAIYNVDASTRSVFIGDENVTVANGFPLTSIAPAIALDLDSSVDVYAIVASGTNDVRTLEIK